MHFDTEVVAEHELDSVTVFSRGDNDRLLFFEYDPGECLSHQSLICLGSHSLIGSSAKAFALKLGARLQILW